MPTLEESRYCLCGAWVSVKSLKGLNLQFLVSEKHKKKQSSIQSVVWSYRLNYNGEAKRDRSSDLINTCTGYTCTCMSHGPHSHMIMTELEGFFGSEILAKRHFFLGGGR